MSVHNKEKETGKYLNLNIDDSIMFSEAFREMEELPGGYEFIVILLKLYSISVVNEGKLMIASCPDGSMDVTEYATRLHHRPKIFEAAIKCFVGHGLMIPTYQDGNHHVLTMPADIVGLGMETPPVSHKGIQAQGTALKKTPPKPEQRAYGVLKNVILSCEDKKDFFRMYENAQELIDKLSIYKGKQDGKLGGSDYAWLLSFADQDGKQRESDAEKRFALYERYKAEALLGCPPPESVRSDLTPMQYAELIKIADDAWEKEHHAE